MTTKTLTANGKHWYT